MVGVNIKTVRTYDPMRTTLKQRDKPYEEPGGGILPLDFYKEIKALADWVAILYLSGLDPDEIPCPHCILPHPPPLKGMSKVVMLKLLKNGNYKCPGCGTTLVSPLNLAWSLLVTEAQERLRREGILPTQGEIAS